MAYALFVLTLAAISSVSANGQPMGTGAIGPIPQNAGPTSFLSPPQQVAIGCARQVGTDARAFAVCTGGNLVLSPSQQAIVDCAVSSRSENGFGQCGALIAGLDLPPDQRKIANCAVENSDDKNQFMSCAAKAVAGSHLNADQAAVFDCAVDSGGDTTDFASCSAVKLIGPHASKEQKIALECAADSGGDSTQFAACAGSKFIDLDLNPEQRIAVECVVTTGGQPYAAAGCITTALLTRELEKCANGFGGSGGCFGDTNDVFGRKGWLVRTFSSISNGPNSVVRDPSQLFGGPHSVFNDPLGIEALRPTIILNPAQLAQPRTIGRVFGHRVCVPWC